jgi:hypothetical protein
MHGDMDFGFWRQNVIDAARRAADRTYQQGAWFGQGPEVDSPVELICTFMGDLVFEEFLVHPKLSQPERAAAVRLLPAPGCHRYSTIVFALTGRIAMYPVNSTLLLRPPPLRLQPSGRSSSRAGVSPAGVQRLSRRTIATVILDFAL